MLAPVRELSIGLRQGQVSVQNAQDLLSRGVRMTGRIRAGRLVFDGCDDGQYPLSLVVTEDPKAIWPVQMSERLRLRMAAIAILRILVDHPADFQRGAGVTDSPLLVEDPHFDHAWFVRHRGHSVVQPLPIVAQHVIGGCALDDVANPLPTGQRGGFQIFPV
jgi:hypothetical protein